MSFLLDTHVWLWFLAERERIRADVRALLDDTETRLYLSAASSWEIAIKWATGRLSLPQEPASYIPSRMHRSSVMGLGIVHAHALQVASIPAIHRDPFDRLLIAQAQVERMAVVTADPVFERYDVEVVRAA